MFARTAIRIHTRQIHVDDIFLYFGLGCLCLSFGLLYPYISIYYVENAMNLYPEQFSASDYAQELKSTAFDSRVLNSNLMVTIFVWTSEFAVKISLLLFFRRLVDRLSNIMLYVNLATGFVIAVWIFLVCEPFILCPHLGLAARSKLIT